MGNNGKNHLGRENNEKFMGFNKNNTISKR